MLLRLLRYVWSNGILWKGGFVLFCQHLFQLFYTITTEKLQMMIHIVKENITQRLPSVLFNLASYLIIRSVTNQKKLYYSVT
jgi:hypothetical protein